MASSGRLEKADYFATACDKVKVIYNILQSFKNWKWGTTNNFLYEWKTNVPDDLYSQEYICLVDAGLEINSAYPLMLPPNRQVDLILSFDFSEGDPFLTLNTTAEYCNKNGIPFPKINIDDKEKEIPSKSVYVFEGDDKGAPDVMHFPLFNNQNCEGKVDEMRKKFSTLKLSYGESELKELLQVSKLELSKKLILEKLQQRN
ncbi:cytosolic phospholipase A2 gamma-like [Mixophyes fleayi]|uniref:cytosolic phospholipase A2 gamma-like n=1 Tax=Mixophyes fleayi TaxID=3061075 RepID=UPI003F4D8B62